MSNRKKREKQRDYATYLHRKYGPKIECPNCKEMIAPTSGHFISPSFNEPGSWICNANPKT